MILEVKCQMSVNKKWKILPEKYCDSAYGITIWYFWDNIIADMVTKDCINLLLLLFAFVFRRGV